MDLDIDYGYANDAPPDDDMLRSPPKKNARFSNIVQQLQPSFTNPTAPKEPSKQTKPSKTSQLKKSALSTSTLTLARSSSHLFYSPPTRRKTVSLKP